MPTASAEDMAVIIAQHGTALRRFTLFLTAGNWSRAEELMQETLIRAWKHPLSVAPSDRYSSCRPWLFTVARHLSIDAERARQARPQETDISALEETAEACESAYDRAVTGAVVRQALARLPQEQREVIVCTYFRNLSGKETSRLLGIPLGTVKSRAHQARQVLRLQLDHSIFQA
ncbi:sigma-70 family RNA polymerase sigma factor [Streptomyces chartreusis]